MFDNNPEKVQESTTNTLEIIIKKNRIEEVRTKKHFFIKDNKWFDNKFEINW